MSLFWWPKRRAFGEAARSSSGKCRAGATASRSARHLEVSGRQNPGAGDFGPGPVGPL